MNQFFSIFQDFKFFLKEKKKSCSWIMIFSVLLGLAYYFSQPSKFRGEASFILQEKSSSLSSLSGLASQFGFDLPGVGISGSLFSGDNILEILKSKKIVSEVLLSTIEVNGRQTTLVDHYLNFSNQRDKWRFWGESDLAAVNFNGKKQYELLDNIQDSILQLVYFKITREKLVIGKEEKKNTIIHLTINSKDPAFSGVFSERLIESAAKFYVQVKTDLSRKNVDKLEKRADSILYLLNAKTRVTSATKEMDANPAFKMMMIPNELAARDKTILMTIYAEVVKNLEIAKITLAQETPAIQLLDEPGASIRDYKATFFEVFLGALLLGIFSVISFWALIIVSKTYFTSKIKE
jgi:hypothetical protein